MDWRHMGEILEAGRTAGLELKNLAVWNKGVGGMGSLLRSQHELVFMFKESSARPSTTSSSASSAGTGPMFGTIPVRRACARSWNSIPRRSRWRSADAIRDVSNRNDIVLDAFSGSGTTIIATASTGRRARVIELEPHYSMSRSGAGRSGRAKRPCTSRATSALPNFGEQRAEGPADAPADAANSADVRVRKRKRAAALAGRVPWPARRRAAPPAPMIHEIGRGKSPKHSCFQKGRSDNPDGRKKTVPNLKTVLDQVLSGEIEISENGRARDV